LPFYFSHCGCSGCTVSHSFFLCAFCLLHYNLCPLGIFKSQWLLSLRFCLLVNGIDCSE
jgi:hypothetical protein